MNLFLRLPRPIVPPPSYRLPSRATTALAALLVATAASPPTLAQPPPGEPAPPAALAAASPAELYAQGVAAAKQEDWPRAYESFLAAWKLKQQYQIGAQLARAEQKLGKHRDAAERLSALIAESKDIPPEDLPTLNQMLADSRAKIATLRITVDREGAEILVDGVVVGVAPMTRDLYVEPGMRMLQARLSGETTQSVPLELLAGQSRQVGLQFGGAAPAAPPDSTRAGVPSALPDASDTSSPPGPRKIIIYGGIGVTAVLAGLGVGFAIASFSKAAERDDVNGCSGAVCTSRDAEGEYNTLEDERVARANVSFWTFAGAGVAGAGTLTYALLTSRSSAPSAAAAGLAVSPWGSGLMISGSW